MTGPTRGIAPMETAPGDSLPGRGPLQGVRVLEFGQIAAGPFAGSLLADLGADVVKVENPNGGDGMRGWPPLTGKDGGPVNSENFASLNRNKRSMAADLKNEADVVRLYHLEGKSYYEISMAMGMPENSIGPLLSRAREKLRRVTSENP